MLLVVIGLSQESFAQSQPNLEVSAENPDFENRYTGASVIQVFIDDLDLKSTDEPIAEPDVTVNGQTLRMAQAQDGRWVAYFAEKKSALLADSTAGTVGTGLDFGGFCSSSTSAAVFGVSFSDTGDAINGPTGSGGASPISGYDNAGFIASSTGSYLITLTGAEFTNGPSCMAVGGEIIPIESTALLLAGAQTFSWMIPVVLSGIGIGLFVVSRKSE